MGRLLPITLNLFIPESELRFQFSRSGGPGGQNVNKVSTKVDLVFDLSGSPSLSEDEKASIRRSLRSRIGSDGVLRLSAQESRSQFRNREDVVQKFVQLLGAALRPRKKRLRTKPTRSSHQSRLESKSRRSQAKRLRGRIPPDS